jgi:sec-independent protein translocase protein TatC
MNLLEHLAELRKRLILCFVCVIILGSICYAYWDILLNLLLKPAGNRNLIYLSIMEPFMARFKLAVWGGFLLGFPYILYQGLAFIVPGLNKREKGFVIVMSFFMITLFYGGMYFGYTNVLAVGITWLEGQGDGLIKANLAVSQYISFTSLFLLAFGVSFETPVIVVILAKLGVVRPITLIKQWRIALVVILLVAAIITPDWSPITMALMAAPMMALYTLGVGLSFIFAPRRKKELQEEGA